MYPDWCKLPVVEIVSIQASREILQSLTSFWSKHWLRVEISDKTCLLSVQPVIPTLPAAGVPGSWISHRGCPGPSTLNRHWGYRKLLAEWTFFFLWNTSYLKWWHLPKEKHYQECPKNSTALCSLWTLLMDLISRSLRLCSLFAWRNHLHAELSLAFRSRAAASEVTQTLFITLDFLEWCIKVQVFEE